MMMKLWLDIFHAWYVLIARGALYVKLIKEASAPNEMYRRWNSECFKEQRMWEYLTHGWPTTFADKIITRVGLVTIWPKTIYRWLPSGKTPCPIKENPTGIVRHKQSVDGGESRHIGVGPRVVKVSAAGTHIIPNRTDVSLCR